MPTQQYESDFTTIIAEINNRVRTLENKYNLLTERLLVVNQNMIEEYKKLVKDISIVNSDIREIKKEVQDVKDVITNLVKEIDTSAKKDQVAVVEKYLNLINPLNYITEEQLDKILEEKLKKKR